PGFGQTQIPPEAWNLDNYAKFVKSFLSKIEVKPYAIVGHSNGGAVIVRGVALGELLPSRLVLLAASGVRNSHKTRRFFVKIIAKIGKVLTIWLPITVRQSLQRRLYGTVGSDMLVAGHMRETFKLTVSQDVLADAKTIKNPTLLIYGTDDKATPIDGVGESLHQAIKGSQLEVVKGADHFVHNFDPKGVSSLIKEFLG
ncbi:MAG: alpha/beta hydrolase, partial [Candidatus Saccharimonadales bacterium]